MRDYEVNLIELIQKLTNGTKVVINKTGTKLDFRPGLVVNSDGFEVSHDCNITRSIVYYLEAVVPLALFGKEILRLRLSGTTNDSID